jgi:Cu/Ag efflux protein CusF
MKFTRLVATFCLIVVVGALAAQDRPRPGQIKKIDLAKKTIVITSFDKDIALEVTDQTRVVGGDGGPVDNLFKEKSFVVGATILFIGDGTKLRAIRLTSANAGNGPQRGKLVKVDLKDLKVTIKAGDKDIVAQATDDTRLFEAMGDTLKARLGTFKTGAEIQFVVQVRDGKSILVGMRVFQEAKASPPPKVDSSKLLPLDELGNKEYQAGFKGGFYPDGKNVRPKAHEEAGLAIARSVQPLNAEGKPDRDGRVVMLSVGMSNTAQASQGFQKVLSETADLHPKFTFVNGAVGGQTASIIQRTESPQGAKYWAIVDKRLADAKSTRAQAQVIWIKEADAGPSEGFPKYAKKLEEELTRIVQILPKRFPNAKLVYLSSRTYGGYATTRLNPEPYAYESGFSVKWLIERQIKGDADLNFDAKKGEVRAPWLSWGPYLWANGGTKRAADGFRYERHDFADDGTHHSSAGSAKIGRLMAQFFRSDSTSRSWFVINAK